MNYGLRSGFNLAGRVLQVRFAHDVVAVENGVGLVAGNFSRRLLRDATANHVPHSGAAKIVEQQARQFCLFGECSPGSPQIAYRLAILAGQEKIFGLLALAKPRDEQAAFFRQVPDARLPVLGTGR